jgi:hypothetical protein
MLRVLPGKLSAEAVKKNLAILDHLATLDKSSGNLQVLKRATRGPDGRLARAERGGAERRLRLRVRTGRMAGSETLAEQEKIESAICVAILAKMAMLRKNQGMLDGKVAKGMWQC